MIRLKNRTNVDVLSKDRRRIVYLLPVNCVPRYLRTGTQERGSTIILLFSRYITVLYFLSDVEEGGETAFPIADNETFDEDVSFYKYLNL